MWLLIQAMSHLFSIFATDKSKLTTTGTVLEGMPPAQVSGLRRGLF